MSRDQRPGKLKVVSGATPVHNRRKGDREPQQGRIVATGAAPVDLPVEAGSTQGPVMALLFLLAAAGSGAVFVLVGRLA